MQADSDKMERCRLIAGAIPAGGLFHAKEWRITPEALPLPAKRLKDLERLGPRLLAFVKACNLLYRQSARGKAPEWIARWLDAGKPRDLIEISRSASQRDDIPIILRPDLILEKDGFALAEIDSVPGGVGLTAWLNETYAGLGELVLGGAQGMRNGVEKAFPQWIAVISEEASVYRPELEWLFGKERVTSAEGYQFDGHPVYRFFEAFDWDKLESVRNSWTQATRINPPLKPFLEEKLWLALFWLPALRDFWKRELGEAYDRDLRRVIPMSWVVEPSELPPGAVLPGGLDVQSWRQVAAFSRKERDLILKISGFSPLAWGSRGVFLGSDADADEWSRVIDNALEQFPRTPWIMQRFRHGSVIETEYGDWNTGQVARMQGRVRVCPYYFVEEGRAVLRGALATICPSDKKFIHGMRDAILVPVQAG